MLVGIFADTHDHLDNIRRLVQVFNAAGCELVLFAGDLVSTFALPPLRELRCPIWGCYGDNEGNKPGLQAGFSILGELREAPACYTLPDGTRVAIVHMERQLRGCEADYSAVILGHTHRPRVSTDAQGRLWINPGEASGWTFDDPTVATWETTTGEVILHSLRDIPLEGSWAAVRKRRPASATDAP
jgi:putative phosphoesterase